MHLIFKTAPLLIIAQFLVGLSHAQTLDDVALDKDRKLYCKIENRTSRFACHDPAKNLTADFQNRYSEITGNTQWWMIERACSNKNLTCSSLMRVKNNLTSCKIEYQVDKQNYSHKNLIEFRPLTISGPNCIDILKSETQNTSWTRDYPLFIESLKTKNKKYFESENLWWVARKKTNPLQQKIDELDTNMQNYHFVFLRGISARYEDPKFVAENNDPTNSHFKMLKTWMNDHHISNTFIVTWYNSPPLDNLEIIRREITKIINEHRKIIFVTHSKGGLDLLNFMLAYPEYWNHKDAPIQGWLSLQIPFWGTTNAQDCLRSAKLSLGLNYYQLKEHLSSDATYMLSPRQAFANWCTPTGEPITAIQNLLNSKSLKILNVKTWTEKFEYFGKKDSGISKLMEAGLKLKNPTDVYVWLPCENMPCTNYVNFQGFHHWDFTKPGNKLFEPELINADNYYNPLVFYNPVSFLRTALSFIVSDDWTK